MIGIHEGKVRTGPEEVINDKMTIVYYEYNRQ